MSRAIANQGSGRSIFGYTRSTTRHSGVLSRTLVALRATPSWSDRSLCRDVTAFLFAQHTVGRAHNAQVGLAAGDTPSHPNDLPAVRRLERHPHVRKLVGRR